MVETRASTVSRSSTASSSRKASIEDYEIGGELGEGAYGRVCFATERANGRKVAVKEINKEKISKVNMEHHIFREKNILNALAGHPNVIQLLATCQDEVNLYFIFEVCPNGNLFELCSKRGK